KQIADAVLGQAPDSSRPFSGDLNAFAGTYTGRGRGRPAIVRVSVEGSELRLANNPASTAPGNSLKYYGNDTFGFQDAVVTFERINGTITKLRLDTGTGYNILTRQ